MPNLLLQWKDNGHTHSQSINNQNALKIGRDERKCDVAFPQHRTISREHAQLYYKNGQCYIRNMSRVNTIVVNEQFRLKTGQEYLLHPDDEFRIGPVSFAVRVTTAAPRPQGPQIRCANDQCNRIVPYNPAGFCPWCGTALSAGTTVVIDR